jgi:hypothetical protein
MAVTAGIVTTVIAVGSAVEQRKQAKAVEKRGEEQLLAERAIESEGVARQRRAKVAEAQVARAQIESQAAVQGFEGSAVTAGTANVASQAGEAAGQLTFAQGAANVVRTARAETQKAGLPSSTGIALAAAGQVAAPFGQAAATELSKSIFTD